MDAIFTAIMLRVTTGPSSLFTDLGGRFFLDEYTDDLPIIYPYGIFFLVSSYEDPTFTELNADLQIQFSFFSSSKGGMEITTIYKDHLSLFSTTLGDGKVIHEYYLTATGYKQVWMRNPNLVTMLEDVVTEQGTTRCKHYAVTWDLRTSLT